MFADAPPRTARTLALTGVFAGPMLALAWLNPALFPALIGLLLAAGLLVLVWRHLTEAWIVWLLVTSLSLEMTLNDLIGPAAFQATIAAVKAAEIGLVGLTILRHGPRRDPFNPVWAFAAMAAAGAVVGIHPDLTIPEMMRSAIGSVTPFLIFFCVPPPGWSGRLRRAIGLAPFFAVALGGLCDLAGLRSLFVDSGGLRLAALGHPAFLASICLSAIYVHLLRWLRDGSRGAALLLGASLLILLLTGARAPMAYAGLVIGVSLMFAPEAAVPRAHRLALCLAGVTIVPFLLVIGEAFTSLRLFTVIEDAAGNLSGRQLLWPAFEAASARAPWFGWGIGSGNVVISPHSHVARLLHTWAAHNEYLRLLVEGGQIGRSLLIFFFAAWVIRHTRRLPPTERLVMRVIFATYAAHAATDNVLISSPACVFFAFVATVFADANRCLRRQPHVA
jgi:O-antigen ligase